MVTSYMHPFSPPIRKDDRYVPLKLSETAIYSALDNPDCPGVVLLHGGFGTGKSTLAAHTAVHYRDATNPCPFDHVVYLECGPKVNTLAKQWELLQILGPDDHGPVPQPQENSVFDLTIVRSLTRLLKAQKLLVILDDVWEVEFLERMVDLFGSRTKCLVVSQLGDLCRGSNFSWTTIRIQNILLEEARKILANHVGIPNIPEHLEVIVDKLISKADGNLLALASIATGIDDKRYGELQEWNAAAEDFFLLLHSEQTARIFGKKYPRSFWSAVQFSFESLNEQEKRLLTLMHMCNELPVPEEVIRILYRSGLVEGESATFGNSRLELESRELVKTTLVSESPVKQRLWSVHSLQKQISEKEMHDAKESTFTSLELLWNINQESNVLPEINVDFSKVEEAMMVMTLGALYFEKQFAMRAASQIGISFETLNFRRSPIEPITRLLGSCLSEQWTETLCACARKVFLTYTCNGVFHDKGISNLLASPMSVLAMLSALESICITEKTTLLNDNTSGIMKALVGFLSDEVGVSVQEAAGRALMALCDNDQHCVFIVSKYPDVLKAIIKVLSKDSHPGIQVISCLILAILSSSQAFVNGEVLHCLEISLSKEQNPRLNEVAAFTLANLASELARCFPYSCSNTVEALVQSLSEDNNTNLQEQAARALANLASEDQGVNKINLEIVNSPKALERLVCSLSKRHNPRLQAEAAGALSYLAQGDDGIRHKIVKVPGALRKLVNSLYKMDNPRLQHGAARTLFE